MKAFHYAVIVAAGCGVCGTGLVVGQSVPESAKSRFAVPALSSRQESQARVRRIFGGEMTKATTPEAKVALAKELLGHSVDTQNTADRFALLEIAQQLALDGGSLDCVEGVIAEAVRLYEIDALQQRVAALEALAAKASPETARNVAEALLDLVDREPGLGDFDRQESLLKTAIGAARRGRDSDLQKSAVEALAGLRDRRKLNLRIASLHQRVQENPDDPSAATELGRVLCFECGDWQRGLPWLRRGQDSQLSRLAEIDEASEVAASKRLAAGDAWWAYASKVKGKDATAAEGRARYHYGAVLGDLSGLERARVAKLLQSNASGKAATVPRLKELLLWLDASHPGSLRGPDRMPIDNGPRSQAKPVAYWADVSGSTGFAQSVASAMPALAPAAAGKRPGVAFSGTHWLSANLASPTKGSLVVVCLPSIDNTHMKCVGAVNGAPGVRLAFRQRNAVWLEIAGDATSVDYVSSPEGAFRADETLVLSGTWPTPFEVSVQGRSQEKSAVPNCRPDGGDGMVLGAWDEKLREPFQGTIYEVRLYDRVLGGDELRALLTDLARKWGASPRQ